MHSVSYLLVGVREYTTIIYICIYAGVCHLHAYVYVHAFATGAHPLQHGPYSSACVDILR